jgi:hypothetical protein
LAYNEVIGIESLLERVRRSWETFEARVAAPPEGAML